MNELAAHSEFLIIKTGQYETFAADTGDSFSLGDVLRTTTLLKAFSSKQKIRWLTHKNAVPLLPKADNFITFSLDPEKLNSITEFKNSFLINLEKDSRHIPYFHKFKNFVGFFYENDQWLIKDSQNKIYTYENWLQHCGGIGVRSWGSMLCHLIGFAPESTLPIYKKPEVQVINDIGLNWHVGNKWPSKKIGTHIWKKIEAELQKKYRISWQTGLDSVEEYAAWIASNKMIISVDSLGLHLANAMNIPIIALFGSTGHALHDAGPSAHYISFDAPKETYECLPCWKSDCFQKIHCSEHLDFNKIYTIVENTLS